MNQRTRESLAKLEITKHQGHFRVEHRGRLLLITQDWEEARQFFGQKIREIKHEALRT